MAVLDSKKKHKWVSKKEGFEVLINDKKYIVNGNRFKWNLHQNNLKIEVLKNDNIKKIYTYLINLNNEKIGEVKYNYKVFKSKIEITFDNDSKDLDFYISIMFIAISTFKYLNSFNNDPWDSSC